MTRSRIVIAVLLASACSGDILDSGSSADAGPAGGVDASPKGSPDGGAGTVDASPATLDAAVAGTPYDSLAPENQQLFDIINEERLRNGLEPVVLRETLICAAERHSADVGEAQLCTHTGTDDSQPGDRVAGCGGGGWSGEIVACGHGSPRSAVDGWLNSPGHRAIMLSGSKRQIGVAVVNNFWTAIFDD